MPSLIQYLALDKVRRLFYTVRQNGGVIRSCYKVFIQDAMKWGSCVGEDKYGNKYFENDFYFFGRNRWVEYADKYYFDYDASQIPAEWYGWMHYKTEFTPLRDKCKPKYKWMADHTENMTGTCGQYTPYSTVGQKIEPWVPPKPVKRTSTCGK